MDGAVISERLKISCDSADGPSKPTTTYILTVFSKKMQVSHFEGRDQPSNLRDRH